MSTTVALRRSSIDAAIVAALLLLVPFRLTLIGVNGGRTAILLGCYVTVGAFALAASKRIANRALLSPRVAAVVGMLAVTSAYMWSAPAPARTLDATAIVLGVAAAVSEEALFRGLLFQRLERYGAAAAIVLSAVIFAVIHVPLYGTAALWVDLAAGLLLGWQRWASGGWGASAATHSLANVLAVLR
ncbi:MAG: lysostaphin resistance A-like protein [Actinomycetota bacterium]